MAFAQSLSVPLTSVRHHTHRMGILAAERLLSELRDETHEHAETLLAPEPVFRTSTAGRG